MCAFFSRGRPRSSRGCENRPGKACRPAGGAAEAFRHAAPKNAAAGLILAGTFVSLTLAANTILAQLGTSHITQRDGGITGLLRPADISAIRDPSFNPGSIRASRPKFSLIPCAVVRDQLPRKCDRPPYARYDRRDASAMAAGGYGR